MKKLDSPKLMLLLLGLGVLGLSVPAYAEEAAAAAAPTSVAIDAYAIDNMFLFFAAVLVLFMQAGFAMVETGLNSAKNAVNILFKNLMDLCIGALLYYVVGYSMMYGAPVIGGFFGFNGFGISSVAPDAPGAGVLDPQVDWLFQVAFAATAATIVSGAVAGRLQFRAYLIYSAVITGIVYPISGYWKWGGGWLDQMGFYDFAGSLVVHAVGGFAGLAGAIVLGPRLGRFAKDGTPKAMPGHNLSLAALGVFILLIGWYGFNPGSQLAIVGADNTHAVMLIATNTTLAAAAGAVGALILAWIMFKKPDLTMALNGVLGGLVGITANCDSVTNNEAIIIGIIAGILVVVGVKLLDMLKIDDPVGAFPVHGMAGVWGGLATGIFGGHPMVAQIVGSVVIPIWAFVTMFILFTILKAIGLLRVSEEDEIKGLDITEHEEEAYAGFQFFSVE
ncbi:ammonium transporter [Chloroherpeton thalassium ATCC 35110]|uniref:Ammonium transporter n=1 Tax=Chloroherpeton thalassium (strain ATCC 35110 / GB-78) TaxID=517418 RepID=B3QUH2_CHLT3|nr:ammonium transporter [Chloroherpeton thalassium]ACF12878.1 ammonium transporter [Chloroherpeton thalassium ATCC 35110]